MKPGIPELYLPALRTLSYSLEGGYDRPEEGEMSTEAPALSAFSGYPYQLVENFPSFNPRMQTLKLGTYTEPPDSWTEPPDSWTEPRRYSDADCLVNAIRACNNLRRLLLVDEPGQAFSIDSLLYYLKVKLSKGAKCPHSTLSRQRTGL